MDAMNLILLLIVSALTALAVSALLYNNMYRRFHDAGEKRDGKIDTMQKTLDTSLVRLARLEDKVQNTPETHGSVKKDDAEAAGKPVTVESVKTALMSNGFTLEAPDADEPDIVSFMINDTVFRIDASHLPFLTLELGYRTDSMQVDVELMKQAAAEVTTGIFIGKVCIYGEGQAVVFSAEWLCDSYTQLRDRLTKYLDIVCEAHKRFTETYDKLKEEKRKREADLASKPLSMTEGASNGQKILS